MRGDQGFTDPFACVLYVLFGGLVWAAEPHRSAHDSASNTTRLYASFFLKGVLHAVSRFVRTANLR